MHKHSENISNSLYMKTEYWGVLTAFIIKMSENFSYDLPNALKRLQIIFCFRKLLFCSSHILLHCNSNSQNMLPAHTSIVIIIKITSIVKKWFIISICYLSMMNPKWSLSSSLFSGESKPIFKDGISSNASSKRSFNYMINW